MNSEMQLPFFFSPLTVEIYSGKGTQPAAFFEDKSIVCRLRDPKITDNELLNKLHYRLQEKNNAYI